ncbi:hypothetical protein F383_36702 [Gossypium arboreum]|uniref:Uncharacterized protein n=1 Tax=Gossypium arboreum TaxID=29729 RepID=A0A0B0MD51_GOSAR|nr:hypothetical protein F383_36702 [Gossypium arboreum]
MCICQIELSIGELVTSLNRSDYDV